MGQITESIMLFNKAYALAWQEIPAEAANKRPELIDELAVLIRAKMATGANDAVTIAAEVVRSLIASGR